MRVLILGGGGMLGQALVAEAARRGLEQRARTHRQTDICDSEAVREQLAAYRPTVLINAAAYTDVDGCESRREHALEVNGRAVGGLAALSESAGVRFLHVSSDYVFEGRGTEPYQEDAATGPASVYGESKRLGEELALPREGALVVRASWLFGPGGRNFAATMARLAGERPQLRVVDDQRGCPTYTPFLAAALLDLAATGAVGLIHYANRPPVTWYGFARAIVEVVGAGAEVVPVSTAEFPRPAPRPAYSVLDTGRFTELLGRETESWRAGLDDYAPELKRMADVPPGRS